MYEYKRKGDTIEFWSDNAEMVDAMDNQMNLLIDAMKERNRRVMEQIEFIEEEEE